MDGLILGAAAGMRFAALKSNGYAFTAFLIGNGSISTTLILTLIRGLLSPLGQGTWTAILSSVLFRESRNGRFRINLQVIGAYLFVSVLHAMWDWLPQIITPIFGSWLDVIIAESIVGIVGLVVLWLRWREAIRLQNFLPPETGHIST